MAAQFKPLAYSDVSPDTKLAQSSHTAIADDPATVVMTDLHRIKPFTIDATAPIDFANSKMIASGVRLLFVLNDADVLVGLITANDLSGEAPIKHMQEHGGSRETILVQDIMTPRAKLKTLQMTDVSKARVGDIIETMKDFGRQHILVVENPDDESGESICGIFSTSQISRQLGIEINISPKTNTFAEFKKSIESY